MLFLHFFHSLCTPYYDNHYPVFARQNGAVSTNVTILHPNIFYFVLDASWSSINSLEYWNKGNGATNVNNNAIYKTIYSPSTVDYTEPKSAAFTGFTSSGGNTSIQSQYNISGTFSKGWNFYCFPNRAGITLFMAALGFRDVYSGRVSVSNAGLASGVGGSGDYWSNGPSSNAVNSRYLDFHIAGVNPQSLNMRSYGFSLRCILEER